MELLRAKYPKMRPVKKPPSLGTYNGFGVSVYGRRDVDPDTGTYVKTYCFCALFIPVLALGAYRVADAEGGGWYFIGKEPLSRFARGWNLALLILGLLSFGGQGIRSHFTSPEYVAARQLNQASVHLKAGDPLKAAAIYRIMLGGEHSVAQARTGLQSALEPCLQSDSADTVTQALQLLSRLPASMAPVVPDAFERGMTQVEKFRAANPDGALEIVRALETMAPKNEQLPPLEIALLKDVVAKNPDHTARVVELAVLYENGKQLEESQKLLLPHREKLGITEGARILGQHFLREAQHEDAYGLLHPYVQSRLASLRGVEQSYTNAYAQSIQRAYNALNNQQAGLDFYQRYEKAPKAEQATMVNAFVESALARDAGYQRALTSLMAANKIVPVTLDLGIVQVNRAQNLADAQARKTELEAAEKTFLSIRCLAGETDEYRLFLGEVYYWLGKAQEGKQLFDQLLAAHKRAVPILLALSSKLRMVGEQTQARELAEEAYRTGKTDKQKYEAASLRAHIEIDNDDRIAWLAKADPNEPPIQIALNSTRGEKALEDQNKELAAQFLNKAIAAYKGLPKNSTSLNNCGLVYLNLFRASGNLQDHQRGLALLEEAMAMEPGNSLLLINTMNMLCSHALMEVVGDALRLGPLGEEASFETLAYLYNDESQRREVFRRLRENPSMKKTLAYLDRALLLAPKRLDLYLTSLQIQNGFRDLPEMQKLQQRYRAGAPERKEIDQRYAESYDGANDSENAERAQKQIARWQKLLEKPAIAGHAPTKVYLQTQLNEEREGAWSYGIPVDAEELVRAASATYEAHPCSATRGRLSSALFFRALDQVARQNAEVGSLVKRTRRGLTARYLITWLLENRNPAAESLRQHPDVQKAVALEKENSKLFTSFPGTDDWALFHATDPEQAGAVAGLFKANASAQLIEELRFEFTPMRATSVIDRYWGLRLAGQEKQAAEIYQQALRKKLPLPPM